MTSDLAARIEAAEAGEHRELLEEAWRLVVPQPLIDIESNSLTLDGEEYWDSHDRFHRMINAEAYESAALMLIGDDVFWRVGHDGEGADPSMFRADLFQTPGYGLVKARAATPALALAAAALRAKDHDRG